MRPQIKLPQRRPLSRILAAEQDTAIVEGFRTGETDLVIETPEACSPVPATRRPARPRRPQE